MKRTLISTVYNEAASIERWIEAVKRQTLKPVEFVIVDGGSRDNTVELLHRGFADGSFPIPRVIVQRCNIAEGRNLAIRNSTGEIIASVDASSFPDEKWLEEITRPFVEHPDVAVVGGWCPMVAENELQKKVAKLNGEEVGMRSPGGDCDPSSRNVAFTREAWASVGGYPEWLTLTAEDSLFDSNLHSAGFRFYYQPSAIVTWEMRPDLAGFLKMMAGYGYGAAESGLAPHFYRRWLLTTLFPPLILFSPNPISYAVLRYRRNAASAWGWVKGSILGRKPPKGWKWLDRAWLSPETLATRERKQAASGAASPAIK